MKEKTKIRRQDRIIDEEIFNKNKILNELILNQHLPHVLFKSI
jgi:hypothetical protein